MSSVEQIIAPLPTPKEHNVVTAAELAQIIHWLRENVIQCIEQSHLKGSRRISVGPKPGKHAGADAINDYTPGLNVISIDVLDNEDPTFSFTHGVVLPTNHFQDFGPVKTHETIVVRSGSIAYRIAGRDECVANAGDVIFVNAGQQLEVQSRENASADYTCFYGPAGRDHVRNALGSAA